MSNPTKNNWFEQNPWKARVLLLLLVLAILELCVRGLVYWGVAPYQRYPVALGGPVFWDDINPVLGVWRYPNKTFRHKASCFDVTYKTNSYGAVDIERAKESTVKRRVVVLGDSYVEGFGVESDKRMTNLLEEKTGIEFLNFGTSGSFGTIQEWLLYESLASQFDHTDVMVFILPANDFSDNNPNDFPKERFRPYLQKNNNGQYAVFYTVDFDKRKREFRNWGEIIKNTIDNTSFLANLLRFATREIKNIGHDGVNATTKTRIEEAHYNKYTEEDYDRVQHSLQQLALSATNRNVYLFTIPSSQDFAWAEEKGYEFRIVKDLKSFAEKNQNVYYKDLLPYFLEYAERNNLKYNDFTHSCDSHWSGLGHQVAAEAVLLLVHPQVPQATK